MKKKSSKLDKMDLLKKALKHLGLKLLWWGSWGFQDGKAGFLVVDGDINLYEWYKESYYADSNYKISKLEDFLSARYFDHCSMVRHRRIENPFFGLSPEELAIQLDLTENAASKSIHL